MKKNLFKISAMALLAVSSFALQSCNGGSDDDPVTPVSNVDPNNFVGTIPSGSTWTLDATKVYKLSGAVIVSDGAQLVIPAGTKIECTGGTSAFVLVKQGGKIFSNGTASSPVVFTSPTNTLADWGGLVICGKAPINPGYASGATTATSEVGEVPYGGTNPTDNSGSITYTRVEYAGAVYNSTKEFNGISLFGVGNGTVIDHVQIYKSNDDGIEFFGGTVNTSYLVSNGSDDDSFDWTEGWTGTNSYWFGKADNNRGNRGIEADNYEFGFANVPVSNPTINNATFIGANLAGAEPQAIKLRRGTKGKFDNIVLSGYTKGIDVEHDETIANVNSGTLKLTNVNFTTISAKASYKSTAGTSVTPTSPVFTENTAATGAGNGVDLPVWATGWTRAF